MVKFKKILNTLFLSMFFIIFGGSVFADVFEDYVNNPARTEVELKSLLKIISVQSCLLDDFMNKNQFINHFTVRAGQRSSLQELEAIFTARSEMSFVCSDSCLSLEEIPALYNLRRNFYFLSKCFNSFNKALEEFISKDDLWLGDNTPNEDSFLRWTNFWLEHNRDKFDRDISWPFFNDFIRGQFFHNQLSALFKKCSDKFTESLLEIKGFIDGAKCSVESEVDIKHKEYLDFIDECVDVFQSNNSDRIDALVRMVKSSKDLDFQTFLALFQKDGKAMIDISLQRLALGKDLPFDPSGRKKLSNKVLSIRNSEISRLPIAVLAAQLKEKLTNDLPMKKKRVLKCVAEMYSRDLKAKTIVAKDEFLNLFLSGIKEIENVFSQERLFELKAELHRKLDLLFAGRDVRALTDLLIRRENLVASKLEDLRRSSLFTTDVASFGSDITDSEKKNLLKDLSGVDLVAPRAVLAQAESPQVESGDKLFSLSSRKFGLKEYSIQLFDLSKFRKSRERTPVLCMSNLLFCEQRELNLAQRDLLANGEASQYCMGYTNIYNCHVPAIALYSSPVNDRADLFHFYFLNYQEFERKGICELKHFPQMDQEFFALNCFGELQCETLKEFGFFEMLVDKTGKCFHHFFKPLRAILNKIIQGRFNEDCQSLNVFRAAREALFTVLNKTKLVVATLPEEAKQPFNSRIVYYETNLAYLDEILMGLSRA